MQCLTAPATFPRRRSTRSPLFPYTTLFRSSVGVEFGCEVDVLQDLAEGEPADGPVVRGEAAVLEDRVAEQVGGYHRGLERSVEHTSELQSPCNLVCRLLLDSKNCKRIHCRR